MAEPSIDIDRVVREVLAELGLGPEMAETGGSAAGVDRRGGEQALEAKPPVAQGGEQAPAAKPLVAQGDLVLTARVVTLSEVEGRLDAVRRLVVPPQAVVTPAVRDELASKSVTLAYGSPVAQQAVPVRLVLVAVGKRLDATPLVRALAGGGIRVEEHRLDCLIAAADRLADELVKPDTLGVLLTRHTAAGLCLANRLRGVRAVLGTDAAAAAQAVSSVGANLVVVDPTATGPFQLKQIVTEFCRGGTRQCPQVFRERLG